MKGLLRANFARLIKSTVFRVCVIFNFALAFITVSNRYASFKKYGGDKSFFTDKILFEETTFIALIAAVFMGLFIGTEYSTGTIRNKLTAGHSRTAVYLANLIVCSAGAVLIHISYLFTAFVGELVLFGSPDPNEHSILYMILSAAAVIPLTAMLLPFNMLVSSRSAGTVSVIFTAFALVGAAVIIGAGLGEPEYWMGKVRNPDYIGGTKRIIYQAAYDILPACQQVRIVFDDMPENVSVFPLWSAAVTAAAASCGVLFFKGKDLK